MATLTILALLGLALSPALAHMFMYDPAQRGALWGNQILKDTPVVDKDAPRDYAMHFPAGDKNQVPGSGLNSQRRAAGPAGWTEFKPEQPGFRWRSGVCGDLKSKPEHLFGGKFYHGGKIVKRYQSGGEITIKIGVVAHHNGLLQFRLCNMQLCGGKMSEACFRTGCKLLERAVVPSCETRNDRRCGPIDPDPRYASNWHMPCSTRPKEKFTKIVYKLPKGWAGPHFVLHMYHVAANSCMPPGVTDYFEGPRGPRWGNCPGQGGARGGYRPFPKLCGGSNFPEEYFQCADIAIDGTPSAPALVNNGNNGSAGSDPAPPPPVPTRTPAPSPTSTPAPAPVSEPAPAANGPSAAAPRGEPVTEPEPAALDNRKAVADLGSPLGPLRTFTLFADGASRVSFAHNARVVIDVSSVRKLTFTMETSGYVPFVRFSVDNARFWMERNAPFFYQGNYRWGYPYWSNAIYNREFVLRGFDGTNTMVAYVTLKK